MTFEQYINATPEDRAKMVEDGYKLGVVGRTVMGQKTKLEKSGVELSNTAWITAYDEAKKDDRFSHL